MTSRKVKLAGISAILLGAPSSASLSSVDFSKLSLSNLFSSPPRRGTKSKVGELDYYFDQKMKIGDSVKELKAPQQKEIISPKLIEVKEFIDLSNREKINDRDSGNIISTTYSEITKEEKTIKLDAESTSQAEDYQKKSKKYLTDYLSGRSKIDRFAQTQHESQPRRSRRSASQKSQIDYPQLTQTERNALLEMYKLFDELEDKKDELKPRLHEIDKDTPISMTVKSRPRRSTVTANLNAMRWTTQPDVEYTTERAGGYGGKGKKPNVWLSNWQQNPYKLFLKDETKYKSLLDIINRAKKDKENFQKSRRFPGLAGLWVGQAAVQANYASQGSYDSKVSNARADFANYVALQMLTWMGQVRQSGKV